MVASSTYGPSSYPWSDLPIEIIELFVQPLWLKDRVRFGATNKLVKSIVDSESPCARALKFPWEIRCHDPSAGTWGLFSRAGLITYRLALPVPDGSRCIGSYRNWLVMITDTDTDTACASFLLNPLDGSRIELPSACIGFRRAVLSQVPTPENVAARRCVVVAIRDEGARRLAYCMPGDEAWTVVPGEQGCGFHDVFSDEDGIYAAREDEELVLEINWSGKLEMLVNGMTQKFAGLSYESFIVMESPLV